MKQEKLESKALELFQRQDFDIEKLEETKFKASNEETEIEIRVLSYEEFGDEEALEKIGEDEKLFIDEGLENIQEKIENDLSILEEDKEKDLEIPSYERIGDIVVISELDGISEEEAVEAVLEHNPGLDSILLKQENLSGEFRVGGYRNLYGEKTETVHREHGVRLKVDPTKMFFSEREGTERKRIFESVNDDDRVLVMFAGAGPFPVTIAKHSKASVVGVEKNPEAVKFARENIEMNSVGDKVEILQGDVREVCPTLGKFDHVLMPSPTNALDFTGEALECTEDGGRLVVYSVEEKDNLYRPVIKKVREEASEKGLDVEVLEKRVTADFSPSKRKVAVEFRVEE
ncbi:class I SAM-dependent methyltransferase [Candidatus Nanosalina sp. VS9-1]|uniref:class I SAM-dependent methyltransferase n=1 Tax=Candidatus Nanosalina sp. VS9-1 TaxID=3388566 RepID=UPI0039DF3AFB